MNEYVVVINENVTLKEGEDMLAMYGFETVRRDSNYRILRVRGKDERLNDAKSLKCVETMEKVA